MATPVDLRITGTADLIAIRDDHEAPSETDGILTVHLLDWKFSKAINRTNRYESGSGPCAHLQNCNYNQYMLQQNMYKWMLEEYHQRWVWRGRQYHKIHVATMVLVVFHKNFSPHGYTVIPLPVETNVISEIVKHRRDDIKSLTNSSCEKIDAKNKKQEHDEH